MKITRIVVHRVDLPLTKPYALSGGRLRFETLDSTVVRLETDDGLVGWGEACPWGPTYLPAHGRGVRAGIAELAPTVLGRDPRQVEVLDQAMDRALPGHLYAKAALDIAAWDIFGKAAGLPVCELLGGRFPGRIPIEGSVGTDSEDEMLRTIDGYRNRGYRVFSGKVGTGITSDLARIRFLHGQMTPQETVSFDANRAWLPSDAVTILNAVRDIPVRFEQPCETFEACRQVRRLTTHQISLDECLVTFPDVVRLYAESAAEVVNLKINRIGGLTKGRHIRDFCVGAGLAMLIMETGGSILADAAAAHLAQSTPPAFRIATWMPHDMVRVDLAPGQGPRCIDGEIEAPSEPGLGVTPDLALLGDPVAVYPRP